MPSYELRWMFSVAAAKTMTEAPQDREAPARALVEAFGGTMQSYHFMLGEYDGVAICTFADNVAAAACSMRATTSGAFTRFETHPLLTPEEARAAMQMVKDRSHAYRSPAG